MGKRNPLSPESLEDIAGKIAAVLVDEIEDARHTEIVERWDELKGHMPSALRVALSVQRVLLDKGYNR